MVRGGQQRSPLAPGDRLGRRSHPRPGGGPVFAGMAYTVGEAGRELFLPGVSGLIVPHGRTEQMLKRRPGGGGGSGGTYTLNMYASEGRPGRRRLGVPPPRAAARTRKVKRWSRL